MTIVIARIYRSGAAARDAGRAEPKEATSSYRRQTPLAGAVGRLERIRRCVTERARDDTREPGTVGQTKQIGMRGVPSRRRRRAREGAHPSMRDRARARDDTREPGTVGQTQQIGMRGVPSRRRRRAREGAHPSMRDRTRAGDDARIGRIRAQDASLFRRPRAQAASAPKMRVCSGGLGLRPHPRPRCQLDPVDSG
jgi:hypothetical protein